MWQWERGTLPATGTAEGLGLTGEATSAQCRALCVVMGLLLPSLRGREVDACGRCGEGEQDSANRLSGR